MLSGKVRVAEWKDGQEPWLQVDKRGRFITKADALGVIDQANSAGLVLQPANARHPEFVCSCCGCCCGMLSMQKSLPHPVDFWTSSFRAEIDGALCSRCGKCVTRCQVNAMTLPRGDGPAEINPDRCIGCGLCVAKCPSAARTALQDWLARRGDPPYRLTQLLPRLWQRPVRRWADASELPFALRQALDAEWPLPSLTLEVRQASRDGTEKMLWRLPDGEAIESVMIPEGSRRTLCISSQAGCPLRCTFCATGTMGLKRNLAAWEIAAQVR